MTTPSPTSRRGLIIGGLTVGAVALLVAVLTTGGGDGDPTVEQLAGTPRIDGEALPTAPGDPAQDEAVGRPAPRVEGADFEGDPVIVGAGEQPELLVFMAAWCPHCQEEMPELVAWDDAGGVPDGLTFTTVVTGLDDTRDNWPPDAWLEREGWTGRTLVDDAEGSVARAFGQPGTPYWVGIDGDGEVAVRVAGRLPIEVVHDLAEQLAATG